MPQFETELMERERRTLQRINQLAEERLALYMKASHGRLSERELQRIDELTRELDRLWHQLRDERAAEERALPRWIAERELA